MPHDLPPDYPRFSARDFALDESFRRWVLQPDEATMSFWHTFMLRHPEQQLVIDEAASVLLHLRTNYDDLTTASNERIWRMLEQAHAEQSRPEPAVIRRLGRWAWVGRWSVAAGLGVLGTLAVGWYVRERQHLHREHTAFGERRTLTLPDGSTVQLNGNSTLTFRDDWANGQTREVWLDGEGFFTVTKKEGSEAGQAGMPVKFITHAPGLDVQVLGTRFNVHARRGKTDVTLIEGKVTLIRPDAPKAKVLELKPGQVASAQPGIEQVALQAATPALNTAWTQQQFVFDKTPLRTVGQQLSDSHGITLVFGDEALADRRFTGNLSSQDVATLLATLAATFDLTVERDSNTVFLRRSQ